MKRTMRFVAIAAFVLLAVLCPVKTKAAVKKPSKVSGLTVKGAAYDKITVKWNKTKNARGYYVYRATSAKGKYTKIKTIKSAKTVSFTNTKVTLGKTYYYKVKAYNGKKTGSFSSVKSAKTKLNTPLILIPWVSKDAVSFEVLEVPGASGYEFYRSLSKTSGFKLVEISNSNNCFDCCLNNNTTYYYKTRAYRTVGGKKVYSAFSTVRSAKSESDDAELRNGISISQFPLKTAVAVQISNNNAVPVEFTVKATFYDKNGKYISNNQNSSIVISANGYVMAKLDNIDENWNCISYGTAQVEYSVYNTNITDCSDKVEIVNTYVDDDRTYVLVQNNGTETIEHLEVCALFCNKSHTLLNMDNSFTWDLKPGKKKMITLDTPDPETYGFDYETDPVDYLINWAYKE